MNQGGMWTSHATKREGVDDTPNDQYFLKEKVGW
jgi:hypothetical protein